MFTTTKVTLIASFQNVRFKGGIYTIANELLAQKKIFNLRGYSLSAVSSCQLKSRSLSNIGKFRFENIRNFITVLKMIVLKERKEKSDGFYILTSTGYGFLKDILISQFIRLLWKDKFIVLNVQFSRIDKILPSNVISRFISVYLLKRTIDSLILCNETTKNDFAHIGFTKKMDILPNFFIPTAVVSVSKFRDDPLRILYLGMMDERKGFDKLLKIFAGLKEENIELHVCGNYLSDDFEKYSKSFMASNQLNKKVFFYGFVESEQKEKIIAMCDVFILITSGEGMAMALLEAMSRKLAVITTDIESNLAIFNESNYELFDVNNLDGIRQRLLVYKHKPHILLEDKEHCYSISKKFSIENHITHLTEIFDSEVL